MHGFLNMGIHQLLCILSQSRQIYALGAIFKLRELNKLSVSKKSQLLARIITAHISLTYDTFKERFCQQFWVSSRLKYFSLSLSLSLSFLPSFFFPFFLSFFLSSLHIFSFFFFHFFASNLFNLYFFLFFLFFLFFFSWFTYVILKFSPRSRTDYLIRIQQI